MREGYEVYEAWLMGHEEDIALGRPFALEIKKCEDFSRMVVRAIVSRSKIEGAERLWVRGYAKDDYLPEEWWIKIIEELDDDIVLERPDAHNVPKETYKVY
jgi:hypothetical protein